MGDERYTADDAVTAAHDMAEAIERLDEAVAQLLESGLSRRALVLLLHDACPARPSSKAVGTPQKPGKREIEQVLDGMQRLAGLYLDVGQGATRDDA